MSSIVNKSGVRFTPKIGKRRSVTSTPNESRRGSVPAVPEKEEDNTKDHDDNEEYEENDDIEESEITQQNLISRRSSVSDTKQRRLSTLSNTTRSTPDLFKKTVEKTHIINVPQTPQKRGSNVSSQGTKRSRSIFKKDQYNILPTPVSTQDPSPPPTQLTKPQAKAPEVEGDDNEQAEIKPFVGQPYEQIDADNPNWVTVLVMDPVDKKIKKHAYNKLEGPVPENILNNYKMKSINEIQLNKFNSLNDTQLTQELVLEEESFKMADLCKPTLPIGKVSSNFEKVKAARVTKMKQRLLRKQQRADAKRNRINLTYDEEDEVKKPLEIKVDEVEQAPKPGIQLKISKTGAIDVDEDSRVLDRHANINRDNLIRQDENPFENIVNSATYGKQRYTDKWDKDELKEFYNGLYQWGTDFGLIAQMFPYRTRRQIKAKFILEERKRPQLVELTLARKVRVEQFDLDSYSYQANKEFQSLSEFDLKLKELKDKHDENLKELMKAKEMAKLEDTSIQKNIEEKLRNGDKPLTRRERVNELRKHETVLGSIDDLKRKEILNERFST